jgi:hypothetical protein
VPLAGPVSFFGFMLLGPAVLIALRVYLQIYVEHGDRLDRLARSVSVLRAPTLVPLQNPVIRLFSGLIFYVLLPVAMMLFAWKAAVFPAWGSGLFGLAIAVIASHVMLPFSKFYIEGDRHRSKLFVVVSGATSKGRKGTALGRIRQLMAIADEAWERDNLQSGLSTGEGLIFHLRDPVSKIGKDGMVEVVDPGVMDKRLMIVTEEFAGTLNVMERAGNTLSPVLRDAWGTSKLQTLTKNSPLKATDTHVSVIGHVTDDELRAVLTRVEMANGFANRFLFARVK